MSNVMAALPNIGGALCSTPQSLADAQYLTAVVRTSNTANGFLFGSLSRERSKMPSLVLISSNLAIADLQIYLGY